MSRIIIGDNNHDFFRMHTCAINWVVLAMVLCDCMHVFSRIMIQSTVPLQKHAVEDGLKPAYDSMPVQIVTYDEFYLPKSISKC